MTNAAAHFTAVRDGHGGVKLTLRHKFRDADAVELGDDGIARKVGEAVSNTSEAIERNRQNATDENGDDPTRHVITTFGPLEPGQTCEFEEQPNGTIYVVVVSQPDELIGNTINSGGTTTAEIDTSLNNQGRRTRDRREYILGTYGKGTESCKLAAMNAANKNHYKR